MKQNMNIEVEGSELISLFNIDVSLRKISGIYCISINGNLYIGSAVNLYQRLHNHKFQLLKNKHVNTHLQRAFNKYNDAYYNVFKLCDKKDLIIEEQLLIDNLKPEYNIRLKADSNLGIKFSDEHKKKLSENIKESLSKMTDTSFRDRSAATQRITKKGISKPYKRTEQGLINNREKRRMHSHIAKLDVNKVKEIKMLLSQGKTLKYCAEIYNVHVGTIQSIKNGLTWFDIKIN